MMWKWFNCGMESVQSDLLILRIFYFKLLFIFIKPVCKFSFSRLGNLILLFMNLQIIRTEIQKFSLWNLSAEVHSLEKISIVMSLILEWRPVKSTQRHLGGSRLFLNIYQTHAVTICVTVWMVSKIE